ncbi:UBX domain-containing protein 4 [Sitodiplosis mosellana]|uniref:UBX domain-containing protein 4 n=1 Tax=Sitodiplosis mosellana TaxID=263140 RepID=UPI002444A67E|nr:UBX domain-containing protein 4 [Sitodiplosis mosellana]
MNWFSGNIAEAVALSKAKNSIFVVYCEGTDELSTAFTELINNEIVRTKLESDDFVAIRVQSDSEAYMQFAAIYKLVPLPSLFFIGKNGAPIEIVTGVTKTVDELNSKIDGVLNGTKPKPSDSSSAAASANLIASEQSASNEGDTEIVCENGVCYKRPKENKTEAASTEDTSSGSTPQIINEEKLNRAKELIERKRKEKEEEDARLAKERELNRRRVGQDLQNFKQRQEESEMKKLQEERKRDKIEEQAARKRILEQIALDKAERAQRFSNVPPAPKPEASSSTVSNPLPPVVSDSAVARIQFKKPDGEIDVKTFGRDELFSVVRSYVEENVIVGSVIRGFALATTFPRHEFSADDNAKSLFDLGLVPSSVILILPLDKAPSRKLPIETSYGIFSMLTTIFWGVVSPMLAAFSYVRNWVFTRNRAESGAAKRANEEELNHNEQAKKRILRFDNAKQSTSAEAADVKQQSGPYKRVGGAGTNIHRLSDTKDSDDENNTWNGNSTQQQ